MILVPAMLCALVAGPSRAGETRFEQARARERLLAELTADYERGDPDRVIQVLSDSLPPAEFTPRLHNLLGLALAAEQRHREAVTAYERGIEAGGIGLMELHVNLGLSLKALGISGRAMAEFERAVEIAPQALEARLALGEGYLDYGRYPQARRQLEIAAGLAPQDLRVLRQRARLADLTGNEGESLRWWAELESRDPDADSARRLGELHRVGEPDAAVGWFECCVERDSSAVDCASALGGLLLASGRDAEALVWLRRAEGMSPPSPQLLHNLLLACQRTGEIDSLEALVARVEPKRADSWGVVALARREHGSLRSALDAAGRAHGLDPEDPDLANIYAVLLHENGRTEEARILWRKILEKHPDHPQARANLNEAH